MIAELLTRILMLSHWLLEYPTHTALIHRFTSHHFFSREDEKEYLYIEFVYSDSLLKLRLCYG